MPKRNSDGCERRIIERDPNQRVFIYYITDHHDRMIYIGQTTNRDKRIAKHVSSSSECKELASYLRSMQGTTYNLAKHWFIFECLPLGVPQRRADELECFLIQEHNTLAPNGCNLRHGNNYSEHKPKFNAIREELKTPFVWPVEDSIPKSVAKAMGAVQVIEDLNDHVGDVAPHLAKDLRIACMQLEELQNEEACAWKVAKKLAGTYDSYPPWQEMNKEVLNQHINSIRELLEDEEVPDAGLIGFVNAISLFAKTSRNAAIDAFTAKSLLNSLYGAISAKEDASAPNATYIEHAETWRKFSFVNKRRPNLHGTTKGKTKEEWEEENSIGAAISNWKHSTKMRDKKWIDVKMRYTDWYEDFAETSKSEKQEHTIISLNSLLKSGVGIFSEPEFEGKKNMITSVDGKRTKEFLTLRNVINGALSEKSIYKILDGIEESRKQWYLLKWKEKKEMYAERKMQSNQRRAQETKKLKSEVNEKEEAESSVCIDKAGSDMEEVEEEKAMFVAGIEAADSDSDKD